MKLRVFTFNLRVEAEVDGINRFSNRHGRVLGVIREYLPDLIGFQEVNDAMREWLGDELPSLGYTLLGCGRLADYRGESTVIAFRRSGFELLFYETKWLSATPSVPGSTFGGDQSRCPRVFSAAVFKPRKGTPFLCLNTHLDHKGQSARLLGALQCVSYVSEKGLPFIITGDMNALPGTPEIAAFTEYKPCGRETVDATAFIGGTFHGFGKLPPEKMTKIDYVFTDMPCDPADSLLIPDEPVDGLYISDHRPVMAVVETEE